MTTTMSTYGAGVLLVALKGIAEAQPDFVADEEEAIRLLDWLNANGVILFPVDLMQESVDAFNAKRASKRNLFRGIMERYIKAAGWTVNREQHKMVRAITPTAAPAEATGEGVE